MADIFVALKREMVAAQAVLAADIAIVESKIRGESDMAAGDTSSALQQALLLQRAENDRRAGLLQNVVANLNSLDGSIARLADDGYPGMTKAQIPADLIDELKAEKADRDAAIADFEQEPIPVTLEVPVGQPIPKP